MSNKAESKDYISNPTVLITGALTGIDRAAALGGKKTSELERENMATDIGTPEDAKAIVKSFYEGGARGEITSFADRLADDFELFVPPSLPWGGQFNWQSPKSLSRALGLPASSSPRRLSRRCSQTRPNILMPSELTWCQVSIRSCETAAQPPLVFAEAVQLS